MFYPAAVYQKVSLVSAVGKEKLFSSFKVLVEEGYLKVANVPSGKKEEDAKNAEEKTDDIQCDAAFLACLQKLKKGAILPVDGYEIKEGETSPPKRYNSGTMIWRWRMPDN